GAHVHRQVFEHRQVAQRLDGNPAVALPFLAHRGPAGQLLRAVDGHRARPTDGRPTRVAERQPAVLLVLDADERVEDGHPAGNVETIGLYVRSGRQLAV